MGMGVSLLLIAVGAILVWAVNATVSGIEIHTIGWILLAVGAIGALLLAHLLVELGRLRRSRRRSPPDGRSRGLLDEHRHLRASRAPLRRGSRRLGDADAVEGPVGQKTTLPMMFFRGTRPQTRESQERAAVVTLHQVHPGRDAL